MRRALIVGINDVGVALAKLLVSNGYDVSMIARNEKEAGLGKDVPAYIYIGNPINEDLLIKAGIDKSELLVALCDDETNMEVVRLAKSHGVPTVVAIVHDKKYLDSLIELNAIPISIADAVLSKIANYVKAQFKWLLFSDETIKAYYVTISSESPYIGRDVIELARGCGVAVPLIIRDGEVVLTYEGLTIEAGDKLLIVGDKNSVVNCVEKIY